MFWSSCGPLQGPYLHKDADFASGVMDQPGNHDPIGIALKCGWNHRGWAVFKLVIDQRMIDGEWLCVNREFVRAGQGEGKTRKKYREG
jgi:hypothetical protein